MIEKDIIRFRTKEGRRPLGYEVRYLNKQLLKCVIREVGRRQNDGRTVTTDLRVLQDSLQQQLFGRKRFEDLRKWRLLMYLQKEAKKEAKRKQQCKTPLEA